MPKERLDILLVARGLAETREKAKAAIMAGLVTVAGQPADKPGTQYDDQAAIAVQGKACPYVSRGGLKLEKAMAETGLTLQGLVCADIGASTGGFTDCMLQHGAARVYAVDVGYGQLDWSLRNRPEVINMERTNIRTVDPDTFPDRLDFASIDVSFISLRLVLPVVMALLRPEGQAICLVKPQFEAGREHVGKNGVVRSPEIHRQVLEQVLEQVKALGAVVTYLTYSPIKGPKGNIEFLLGLRKTEDTGAQPQLPPAASVVERAHQALHGADREAE